MTSNLSSKFPPLAAVFLTHFDDTKGQSVLYYKSYDETGKLNRMALCVTRDPRGVGDWRDEVGEEEGMNENQADLGQNARVGPSNIPPYHLDYI